MSYLYGNPSVNFRLSLILRILYVHALSLMLPLSLFNASYWIGRVSLMLFSGNRKM